MCCNVWQCTATGVSRITCIKHMIYVRRIYISVVYQSKTIKNPTTTPHSTYHCDIYILHIVKVSRHLALIVLSFNYNMQLSAILHCVFIKGMLLI